MKQSIRRICLTATAACGLLLAPASAQTTATTDPVGAMSLTIPSGSPTVRSFSFLSFPLLAPPQGIQGNSSGEISAVGANYIEVHDGNWSSGELSNVSYPFIIRFESGDAEGLTLLISSASPNSSDRLFFDTEATGDRTLPELGVAVGDAFSIYATDTIRSAFGDESNGIVGGSGIDDADVIEMYRNGAWERFYFDTSRSEWVQFRRGLPGSDDVPILPQTGVLYSRIGANPLDFGLVGHVANVEIQTILPPGVSFIGTGRPTEVTLVSLGLQNIPNWVSSSDFENADTVEIFIQGAWSRFWFDGSDWRQFRRGFPLANDVILPEGMALVVNRVGASGSNKYQQNVSY